MILTKLVKMIGFKYRWISKIESKPYYFYLCEPNFVHPKIILTCFKSLVSKKKNSYWFRKI